MAAFNYSEPRSPRGLGFPAYLTVPCSPSHSVHSQPSIPRHLAHEGTGRFHSLPRKRREKTPPGGDQPQARNRTRVNSALQDYLKSLNSMTRSIVLEKETVEKEHQCEWRQMDRAMREEVVNDHFIPADVRFHYDFDQSERASSRCSFTSCASWGGQRRTPSLNGFLMEGGPTHLSQPNDWDDWSGVCGTPLQRRRSGEKVQSLSRSNNDLMQRNQWQHSTAHEREDLSRSQPMLYSYGQDMQLTSYPEPEFIAQPTFNRLHKKQLSFRPSHKQHAVRPPVHQQTRQKSMRDGLGSDGESQRTSDEDLVYEQRTNLLGFQRSKLRSYSMRTRRNVRNNGSTNGVRSSVRSSNRVRPKTPDSERKRYNTQAQSNEASRPSHFHNYSNISTDTDFDEEIDLPDDELMMDHIQSPTHINEGPPTKPQRFSKSRRSQRSSLKCSHETQQTTEITQISIDDTDANSTRCPSVEGTIDSISLLRVSSQDSLDTISRPPSVASKNLLQSDDDVMSIGELSRMTPDSMISSASSTYRPKSKMAEMAIMRNRRGKRGGSSYTMVTSEFADRHTQFKSNMLKKHISDSAQTSASTTRASTPVDSRRSEEISRFLKPPSFSLLPISKQNSLSESVTSDLPRSPDHLCSPPSTPLAIVYTAGANLTAAEMNEKRESGYLSSSCESFQVAAPFRR